MNFTQFQVDDPFDQFLESIIHFEGYTPEHSIEKVVPDGSINLIFELDGQKRHVFDNESLEPIAVFTNVWLSGVQKEYITISACKDSEMFVIRFKPGGLYPFVTNSVSEFTDEVIPAENVFGKEVLALRGKLLNADSLEKKKEFVLIWLQRQRDENRVQKSAITRSIERIKTDPRFHQNNLGLLIEESGYSHKQFIALFREYVGITPKYFQRITRFNELLVKIQNKEQLSWTEISYECGFYDQAHFIKEFRHFCGYNPKDHLETPLKDERSNFFPVD